MSINETKPAQALKRERHIVEDVLKIDLLDKETQQLLLKDLSSTTFSPASRLNLRSPNPLMADISVKPSTAKKSFLTPMSVLEDEKGKLNKQKGTYPANVQDGVRSGSMDLVSTMAARLRELEKKHKVYQNELKEMHKKYHQLELCFQNECHKRAEAEALLLELYDGEKKWERVIGQDPPHACEAMRGNNHESDSSQSLKRRAFNGISDSKEPLSSSLHSYANDHGGKLRGNNFSPLELPSGVEMSDRSSDNIRIMAKCGSADPRNACTGEVDTVMLFNPSTRLGASTNYVAGRLRRVPSASALPPLDIPLMIRNARILSDHVGWKEVIVSDGQGRVANRDVVSVVVYKNGISVNGGAFRPFDWALCKAFVQDLMEGYYPYEFKDKYPGGFPIEVVDRSSEEWHGSENQTKAASVGSAVKAASHLRSCNVHSLQDSSKPTSKDTFLKQLPGTRITSSGHLVGVRSTISSLLEDCCQAWPGSKADGCPDSTIRHVTTAESAYSASLAQSKACDPNKGEFKDLNNDVAAYGNLVSLAIRLPSGKRVLMRMSPEDTIEQLRNELLRAAPEVTRTYTTFEICQAFPFRLHKERTARLGKLGLTRNCTLLLRAAK